MNRRTFIIIIDEESGEYRWDATLVDDRADGAQGGQKKTFRAAVFAAVRFLTAAAGIPAVAFVLGCQDVPAYPMGGGAQEGIIAAIELGFPVSLSDDRESELVVVAVPGLAVDGRNVDGYASPRYGCKRFVFFDPELAGPYTVAHELGHLLGLRHVRDAANVMHPSGRGSELTDEQLAKVARVAGRLAACLD